MSVLSQAKNTLMAIAKKFRDRVGVAHQCQSDTTDAVSRVSEAELKTKRVADLMARVESDTREAGASLGAVISSTQTADRHGAVAKVNQAASKAQAASAAMRGLTERYKELRAAIVEAQTKVNEAKAAQSVAADAIKKTADSL